MVFRKVLRKQIQERIIDKANEWNWPGRWALVNFLGQNFIVIIRKMVDRKFIMWYFETGL